MLIRSANEDKGIVSSLDGSRLPGTMIDALTRVMLSAAPRRGRSILILDGSAEEGQGNLRACPRSSEAGSQKVYEEALGRAHPTRPCVPSQIRKISEFIVSRSIPA